MERREALTLIGTVASVTVAGCSSESLGDESDDGNGGESDEDIGAESDDSDANAETDGDDRTTSETPERVVERYYRALVRGDAATANEFVVNEESDAYVDEDDLDGNDDAVDKLSFSRLEEISLRTWLEETERIPDDEDPDEVVQFMRRWLENQLEEEGYDE